MKVTVITGADSKIGPALKQLLDQLPGKCWSFHGLYAGTEGREGVRWTRQLTTAERLLTLRSAMAGGVKYVMSCKSYEWWCAFATAGGKGEAEDIVTGIEIRDGRELYELLTGDEWGS